ncbi:MAG: DUF1631 family protein [Pseudomonadota bacterium]
MSSIRNINSQTMKGPPLRPNEVLHSLVSIASGLVNDQLSGFSSRLTDALMSFSELSGDAKEANLSFNVGNLLKNNGYAFFHVASALIEKLLLSEANATEHSFKFELARCDGELSLVSYEEMDNKVLIAGLSRPMELSNADAIAALNIRMACLLGRDEMATNQNPFRPAALIEVMHKAWCEFDPNPESQSIVLPLFRPEVFLDLAAIYSALNNRLIAMNIVPGSVDSYRIKKTDSNGDPSKKGELSQEELTEQLRRLLSPGSNATPGRGFSAAPTEGFPNISQDFFAQSPQVSKQLSGYLMDWQTRMATNSLAKQSNVGHSPEGFLPRIKDQAPKGALTHVDEKTIDLLSQIFDSVFNDQHIPSEIKDLIGFLQIPVLKAALTDKEFFFKESHPARRMIELMSKSSMGLNKNKGQADPLFQAMKRNVDRVQLEFDQEKTVFADVVSDLESYIEQEEVASTEALSAPITKAIKQEKIVQAKKSATSEVAVRIGTGEVVAFVESFLERKWIPVLTIAYSVKDDKPQALENALQTMDDLIWSVKPKITMEQRKELIAKLPSMLVMLNKWLNVVKWEDSDRLQFFAELAECHASIVRAPLELSPERQLEIAVDVAKKAAERRLEKRANAQPEPVADDSVLTVDGLKRAMWLEFDQADGTKKHVKLAWISPLRTLFIFSTNSKQEAFSLSAEELAQEFRDTKVRVVLMDGLVNRALAKALEGAAVNDDSMTQTAVA